MKSKTLKLKLKKEVIANLTAVNTVKGGTFADSVAECSQKPYHTIKVCRDSLVGCNTDTIVYDCNPLSQGCPGPVSNGCNPTGGGITHYCATGNCKTNGCVVLTVEDGCHVYPVD